MEPMNLEVSVEDQKKINTWLKDEVYPKIIADQREKHSGEYIYETCWELGYPYEGAIGGGLTYQFTPTSLGWIFVVTYPGGYELNLTDYDSW